MIGDTRKETSMRRTILPLLLLPLLVACNTTPRTEEDRATLDAECDAAITTFRENDYGLKGWFESAAGYAIFPSVGKGGMGIGGAFGRGQVYRKGELIGYSTLSQATIGFQLGGQAYSEVIFFEDGPALERFLGGNFEFGAQASAVAATAGASADADYAQGVAVFTLAKGGLMYEASVGGQKFTYEPR
jgi:lipid-binding SYLF domain-containing protein